MAGNMGVGQPIFILPEGTLRNTGRDAQSRNIAAAKMIADSVRTTLGPKGMDKMLIDSIGDITITNDGATILREMEIENPAAKMMVEVAKTQEDEVGDGTTTAVILTGELLKKAEGLLEQEIHPTLIIRGFRIAKDKALKIVESISEKVDINDMVTLEKIAMTAMTGKGSDAAKDSLAKIAVDAITIVADNTNGKLTINKDDVKIEKKQGGSIDDTELIRGLVIDKEIVHPSMPKSIKSAKITLLDVALEVKETETNAEIRITDPQQLQAFLDQESRMLKDMVKKVVDSGCNVVFCQKGIDDLAQHYLAKQGIAAARRVKKSDMEKLAKATGAKIVSTLEELSKEDLGYEAIEIVPRTLSESTGRDPIDLLVELRAQHEKGNVSAGVDVINGKVSDMKKMGVVEPLKIKTQAIKSASEAADMILRIDDIIMARSPSMPSGGPRGGMPDMDMGE
ncbi:MAG: thermosome subunit beta [Candidatus Aenigmarchaeota archaeon]|nr:thermosome subunit beta [Candidatus Aenigmarchaeota archaeon]